MKNLAILMLTAGGIACSVERPAAETEERAVFTACPKISGGTPWNLVAKRGVDFWWCTYTHAATGKPLFEVYLGNHLRTEPLKLYGPYPDQSTNFWFQELPVDPAVPRTYWLFQQGGTRAMSVLAVKLQASTPEEFKGKAALATSLAP
jgi:hypothetical protein